MKESLFKRFRAWQLKPFSFGSKSEGRHQCANCGTSFDGDYCPGCGQKYNIGPVDWVAVKEDLFSIVGLTKPSSLVMYLAQILARPGYLIHDYISGRRQVCSSPVGKLGTVAVGAVLVNNFTKHAESSWTLPYIEQGGLFGTILGWLNSNLDWAILIQTLLLIFPTWLLFRYAPKFPRHTLPQGIYIQVFMSALVLIGMMLSTLFGRWMLVFIPIYYVIAYHQLFGYSFWGTLWRTLLCLGIVFYFFGVAMMVCLRISREFWAAHTTWEILSMFGAFLLLGAGILWLGWRISKRSATASPQS